MSTPAAMCLAVRRMAMDWGIGTMQLSASMNSTATTMTVVDYPDTLGIGHHLHYGTEIMELTGDPGPSMTVRRGQLGTTAAAIVNSSVIIVQPRFTNIAIIAALNEALHILSGLEPREVFVTDSTLLTAADTESFAMPAETVGEGEYIDILSVELETATAGLYRPIYTWFQEGRWPPTLRLKGNEQTGRDLRLRCTQAYYPMAYTDVSRPTGLIDAYEVFLTKYAAGLLLEQQELYAADWVKQDVQVASDFRGRMQVIGRNMQVAAETFLQKVTPGTRNFEIGDSRNYRR